MANVSIRIATKEDLPVMLWLDREIFGAYGGDEDPEVIAARLTETEKRLIIGGMLGKTYVCNCD